MVQSDEQATLQAGALGVLEFDAIRRRLAALTSFPLARELALALHPQYEPQAVDRLRQETAEASYLLSRAGGLELSSAQDIRSQGSRASLQGALSGPELYGVLLTLRACRVAQETVLRHRRYIPLLASIGESLCSLPGVEEELGKALNPQGEVVDEASPDLRRLREAVKLAHDRLVSALNRIIRSPQGRESLQESIITLRSERMVLPVKAEMKGKLRGLVHDVSDSGATVFTEPWATVELGNSWRKALLEERREVGRVLRRLSALVGEHSPQIAEGIEALAYLDLVLARARLGAALEGALPQVASALRLVEARHPLLLGQAVPISLEITPQRPILLITGPNAGGKTVALKTVGLLALMHQAGLPLLAGAESRLPIFDAIYADIGDFQSIEQARSTFSAHIANIAAILRHTSPHSLVLLDELGTSTDPEEGAALAQAVLSALAQRGAMAIATGHYRRVANFVEGHPAMANASVELNPTSLTPTYRLTPGIPGRSYALAIASHLGLEQEVVAHARSLMEPTQAQAEALLTQLQQERQAILKLRQEAEAALKQAEEMRQRWQREVSDIASQKAERLAEARRELLERVEGVRGELRRAEKVLQGEASAQAVRQALEEVSALRQEVREWHPPPAEEPPWWHHLRPGDLVKVKTYNLMATYLSPPDAQGGVEVLIGSTRARFPVEELAPTPTPPPSRSSPRLPHPPPSPGELNVRGMRVEDALLKVEEFIDRSLRQGFRQVRIIHGHGTGVLRKAIRERLSHHPLVGALSPAEPTMGGEGVTVVELK